MVFNRCAFFFITYRKAKSSYALTKQTGSYEILEKPLIQLIRWNLLPKVKFSELLL